jgi:hypothetical protein
MSVIPTLGRLRQEDYQVQGHPQQNNKSLEKKKGKEGGRKRKPLQNTDNKLNKL